MYFFDEIAPAIAMIPTTMKRLLNFACSFQNIYWSHMNFFTFFHIYSHISLRKYNKKEIVLFKTLTVYNPLSESGKRKSVPQQYIASVFTY